MTKGSGLVNVLAPSVDLAVLICAFQLASLKNAYAKKTFPCLSATICGRASAPASNDLPCSAILTAGEKVFPKSEDCATATTPFAVHANSSFPSCVKNGVAALAHSKPAP